MNQSTGRQVVPCPFEVMQSNVCICQIAIFFSITVGQFVNQARLVQLQRSPSSKTLVLQATR